MEDNELIYEFENTITTNQFRDYRKLYKVPSKALLIGLIVACVVCFVIAYCAQRAEKVFISIGFAFAFFSFILSFYHLVLMKSVKIYITNFNKSSIKIYEDHLFIVKDGEQKSISNICYDFIESVDELEDSIIMTMIYNAQPIVINKRSLNNVNAYNYLKEKLQDKRKLFEAKKG